MSQPPQTYDEAVCKLFDELSELVIRKHHDYGTGNIINTPFNPQLVIAVREHEKIARVANLLQQSRQASFEGLRDSWLDIIGYAVAGLMVEDGTFTLPLESELRTHEG